MASYSTNEFKAGLKVMLDNDPCAIIENEFVKEKKGLERQYQDKYNEYKTELDGATNELLNQKEQLVSSLGDLEKDANFDNIATDNKIKDI